MAETADDKHELEENEESTPSGESKDDANGTGETGKSSKLDKLLHRLQGHGSADHSRESSPDPSVKESGGGRSSRRKPKVTHKVVEKEDGEPRPANDEDVVDDAMNLAIEEFLNSSEMDKSDNAEEKAAEPNVVKKPAEAESEKQESIDVDEDGNLILPEGTVVVQPEAVTDNKPVFKGPEFRTSGTSSRKSVQGSGEIDLNVVHCSACNHQINTNSTNSVKRHPVLKVVLCKRCYNWYASDEIIQDEDGMDEQCRWCGEGGDLLCCDFCHNAFCKGCIRRNLGRGELSNLLDAGEDSKWHCYVCDPKPLAEMIYNTTRIIDAIEAREKKRQERENRKEEDKKKRKPEPTKQPLPQPPQKITRQNRMPDKPNQNRSQTVMNLLRGAQQNIQQKQPPRPMGMTKGMMTGQKPMPQLQAKPNMRSPTIGSLSGSTFIEWNFRINENNVMPIIDRAMMVTESMHMLLSSLRDDVQKAGNSNSSQKMMVKIESAGKLRRALTAFNKSFFDLSIFSQKTSAPATVRKIIEEQIKVKQQLQKNKGGQQPVRPVRLLQHGQQVVMLPSGATVIQPAKPGTKQIHQQKQHITKAPPMQKPRPVNSGEVIELLDSDEESSKEKTPPKKQTEKTEEKPVGKTQDDSENPEAKTGFRLKVALGGAGHKLKGPLSKRKKIEEIEARREKQAKERREAEEAKKREEEEGKDGEGSYKDQEEEADDGEEQEKPKDDSKLEEGMEVDDESREKGSKDHESDGQSDGNHEPDADNESQPDQEENKSHDDGNQQDNGDNQSRDDSQVEDDSEAGVVDSDEPANVNRDVPMEDSNGHHSGVDEENSNDDYANFKNVEEQLKQLNGSLDDSTKMDAEPMDADSNAANGGVCGDGTDKSMNESIPQLDGVFDSCDSDNACDIMDASIEKDRIVQLDGVFDNRDSSSGSGSPVSFQDDSLEYVNDTPSKRTSNESYSVLQFEPLFNLDDLSSSNSEGYGASNGVVFELGGDDEDEINGLDESVPASPLKEDDEICRRSSRRHGKSVEEESPRQRSKGSKKAADLANSDEESPRRGLRAAKQVNGDSKTDDRSTVKHSRGVKQSSARISDEDDDDEIDKTPRKSRRGRKSGSCSPRSGGKKSPVRRESVKRTRKDIEAQRQLHRELLDEESDEETSDSDEDEAGEDSDLDKSSGDEYNPRGDVKQLKADRKLGSVRRRGRGRPATKVERKDLRAIRSKKSKKSEAGSSDEDESSDDDKSKHSKHRKSKDYKTNKKGSKKSESDKSETGTKSKKHGKKSVDDSEDEKMEDHSEDTETVSKHRSKKDDESEESQIEHDSDDNKTETKSKKSKDDSGESDKSDESGTKSKKHSTKSKVKSDENKSETKSKKLGKKSKDESVESNSDSSSKKQLSKDRKELMELDSENDSEVEAPKSESSDHNSDLENDIEKFAKKPVFSKKKTKKKKELDKSDVEENDRKDKKGKKDGKKHEVQTRRGKTTEDLVADLSSGEDIDDEPDPVQDDSDQAEQLSADEREARRKRMNEDVDEEEDARARKALLADDSSEDGTDDEFGIVKKSRKSRGGRAGSRGTNDDDDDDDDDDDEQDYDSDDIKPSKRKQIRSALLDAKISDSDSDVDNLKKRKILESSSDSSMAEKKKSKKKKKKKSESEDSDSDTKSKKGKKGKRKRRKKKSSSSSDHLSDSDSDGKKKKKKKRRRIKIDSDSSAGSAKKSNEEDSDEDGTPGKKKKNIRKIIKDKKLSKETISAAQAEEERRQRAKERQKLYNLIEEEEDTMSPTKCPITTKLSLELDEDKEPIIEVNRDLVRKLKPHQVEAVKFMWDCVAETTERLQTTDGGGCILAHCMGLGKTLSVITLVSTLMSHEELTKIRSCLVVCPLNTILNWQNEFEKWLPDEEAVDVWEMSSIKDNYGRANALEDWLESGGIMIIGYDMYRNLSTHKNIRKKKLKDIMTKTLVDPGPDLVVCDEGHILKNDSSALSKAMTMIRTKRRIALTGTPLQNNLVEYHCMVDFVKPKLLGTRKEFTNRFVNPINNGQCSDSRSREVKLMKRRAHILHETLAGCVQRRDYSALTKFLMPKHEYIVSVRLSPKQINLYQKYLDLNVECLKNEDGRIVNRNASLFSDYNNLMRIWTHPWALRLDEIKQENKRMLNDESSEDSFVDDNTSSSESEANSTGSGSVKSEVESKPLIRGSRTRSKRLQQAEDNKENGADEAGNSGAKTRSTVDLTDAADADSEVVSNQWWGEYVEKDDQFKVELGGKIMVLAEVLKMCESIGDKVLLFSQSLISLDLIEEFLEHWDQLKTEEDPSKQIAGTGSWVNGLDYYRMDGSTSAQTRNSTVASFNDLENTRMRLFLISTRAGSLGINLVAANRVIVFDASWNPSHDLQSIFRVYRFGQTKPVYVYRLLAQGTMEEKIYERQVIKQSLSQRVVDEHQIERHFSTTDLQELYTFRPDRLDDPDRKEPPVPKLPKDRLLAELMTSIKDWLYNYHEHDSLLENIQDENLTEEEKKAAWEEYEAEKKGLIKRTVSYGGTSQHNMYNQYGMPHSSSSNDVQNIVPEAEQIARAIYAANPGISQEMLQQKVHQYLQQRMDQHRMLMMQREQERRMQEEMIKLQRLRMERYRQQEYLASLAGNPAPDGQSDFTTLLRAMTGQNDVQHVQDDGHDQDAEPAAGSSGEPLGLLNMLRKQTENK